MASGTSGKYTISGGASGTAGLFSSTAWTGGKLDSYLGISASPSNPLSAWLHATQSLDPKAMGYWVFQANLGMNSLGGSSGTGPLLKLNSSLPQGNVIVAFLETGTSHSSSATHLSGHASAGSSDNNQGDNDQGNDNGQGNDHKGGTDNDHGKGKGKSNTLFTATANGSALFEVGAGSSGGQPVPQPGSGGGSHSPTSPTHVGTTGVPEPGTFALLLTALLGFGISSLLPRRPAYRLLPPRRARY